MKSNNPSKKGSRSTGQGSNKANSECGGRNPRPTTKFRGNCSDLEDHIFDCSDHKQADTYVNTHKRLSEYAGATYKHGGDIRSSIIVGHKIVIPLPVLVPPPDATALTPAEEVQKMIFKGEIDAYIKQKGMLNDNVKKAFSLVIGQYTDLLQSKLKQHAPWKQIYEDQNALALLDLIKAITFKFEDQKFLLLALY